MPTFKSVLPFWRHLGPKTGLPAHHIRYRPLPKAILTGTKHELMYETVMRNDDEIPLPPPETMRCPRHVAAA